MLVAAVILVGAVAGLDLVLTFAILRRLRTMQTRPVSSDEGAIPLPSTGYIVPEFSIVDDLGVAVTRADLAEGHRTVVTNVPTIRPPLAPIGWPSATAPPLTLTSASSAPSSFVEFQATDENASLISTRSTSSIVLPARSSAIAPAFAGVRARYAKSSAT